MAEIKNSALLSRLGFSPEGLSSLTQNLNAIITQGSAALAEMQTRLAPSLRRADAALTPTLKRAALSYSTFAAKLASQARKLDEKVPPEFLEKLKNNLNALTQNRAPNASTPSAITGDGNTPPGADFFTGLEAAGGDRPGSTLPAAPGNPFSFGPEKGASFFKGLGEELKSAAASDLRGDSPDLAAFLLKTLALAGAAKSGASAFIQSHAAEAGEDFPARPNLLTALQKLFTQANAEGGTAEALPGLNLAALAEPEAFGLPSAPGGESIAASALCPLGESSPLPPVRAGKNADAGRGLFSALKRLWRPGESAEALPLPSGASGNSLPLDGAVPTHDDFLTAGARAGASAGQGLPPAMGGPENSPLQGLMQTLAGLAQWQAPEWPIPRVSNADAQLPQGRMGGGPSNPAYTPDIAINWNGTPQSQAQASYNPRDLWNRELQRIVNCANGGVRF